MTSKLHRKALSLFVVWTLAASLFVGLGIFLAGPAAAQTCERAGGPTAGDWTIAAGDTQVCDGIVIVMDGNLIVQGSLTIRNGGLKFVEDTAHIYGITVSGSGILTIENSKVWTETNLINPYLKLAVTLSGTGSLTADGTTFAFPGTFSAGVGTTATFRNSIITGTEADVRTIFFAPADQDENDDGPGLTFSGATAWFFASRVERLYENASLIAPDTRQAIRLMGGTVFTAVDTFLGIDFSPDVRVHNTLSLSSTAVAYLYGVTSDSSQNPPAQDLWVPAIAAADAATAYLFRWAEGRVIDANGVPVPGADIDADLSGPESGPAYFPDNGNANVPRAEILGYLGKTVATWDDTDVDGTARMPLLVEWVDSSTMPDSRFIGTYTLNATIGADFGTSPLTFAAYPALDDVNASMAVTVTIGTLVLPLPDLTPVQPTFTPATPKEGQTVQIDAPVANLGAGGASDVFVRIFDGVTLLNETTIPFVGAGGQQVVTTLLPNATAGQHVIRVSVDPNATIIETADDNNLRGFQLLVTPLGPDLEVQVSFDPDPGFQHNPVELIAGVTNVGDLNATNVLVRFYVQETVPDASSTPVGSAVIPTITISATASVNWTPTSLGTFRVWAWVDPLDDIPEPAPYLEDNNLNSNLLAVIPAPDLVVFPQDLTMADPFPRVGVPVTLEAVVRNNGQAAAGPFRVDFTVDGADVGFRTNPLGLLPGERWATSIAAQAFSVCGAHSIGLSVDSLNQVDEGSLFELNNLVTSSVQVYPSQVLSWASGAITADQAFSSSLEITGPVSIADATITIVQDQDACGRYYVKVLSGGSLTFTNASLDSNWPLVVFVADGGTLTADDTVFTLDVLGKGVLHSKGTLTLDGATVVGDLVAKGTRADLRGSTFFGGLFHVDTAQMSRIWDAQLPGVTTIELASDAPGQAVPDFDVRNVTFNQALTAQLVFSGDQWVHLTSVDLTKPGDWWAGMLTQNARVTRHFWLLAEAVDGTGTPIQDPTTNLTLYRYSPGTLTWDPVPDCAPGECYFNANNTWPVSIPTGRLLYRTPTEDRYGSSPPDVRATYMATGRVFIEGQLRFPDMDISVLLTRDTAITLVFSELTPDLNVTAIAFTGENGVAVDAQPLGRPLTIEGTISNSGEIITRNVLVNFYSADVDVNRDGFMDNPHSFYADVGVFIGSSGPLDIPALSNVVFTIAWTPVGAVENTRTISVVVDPNVVGDPMAPGVIAELDEANNLGTRALTTFIWPDLHLAGDPVVSVDPPFPIVNNPVNIEITVSNEGTATATDAEFGVHSTANVSIGDIVVQTVARGATTSVTVVWTPTAAGLQTIRLRAIATGGVFPGNFRNWDFDQTDNFADKQFDVRTQPELSVIVSGTPPSPFRAQAFSLNVSITNAGQTDAFDIVVDVQEAGVLLGAMYGLDAPPGQTDIVIPVAGIELLGDHTLDITVDANETVKETDETDNTATIMVTVLAPQGEIDLQSPQAGQSFMPGDRISVFGFVRQNPPLGTPIGGVTVTARLVDGQNLTVLGTESSQVSALNDGSFIIGVDIPSDLAVGPYRLQVDAADASISDVELQLSVFIPCAWWECPFLGLPVWIWLIVVIGAAAAIGGGTAYVKFVGLGKLVECGECGAFIAEDSTTCPKCGVEFERDMAKCSNCQAWIPVDVKQCPECGVEFATGEIEMADYEAELRRQYEDVKRKFRDQAQAELGRTLSDKEFESWWRTQATFVTFEDWMREEEEKRRMGSRPCPNCNTLNSVTATVCHKCGTLLEEVGKPEAPRPPAAPPAAPEAGPEEAPSRPAEPIPKKVVKKPVVQKKVIRRPVEEEREGEGTEGEQT